MDRKRTPVRMQPPRAAKRPKNAAATNGPASSLLVPARNNNSQRGNSTNQADKTEFRLESILSIRLIFMAIVQKMSFRTVSRLVRTRKSIKEHLFKVRPSVQIIPRRHGCLEIQNDPNQTFLFENTCYPPMRVVLNETFFRFENITFLTSMGAAFFARHVKERLRVFGRGTECLVLKRKLSDAVLRGIFEVVSPECVMCSPSMDPENRHFPNLEIMEIVAGGPYGAQYVCGNKIIRLLARHRLIDLSLRWQFRKEVFHNLVALWIAGADVADGKRIILGCTNASDDRHGDRDRDLFARYNDDIRLGSLRLRRNSANSSNLLECGMYGASDNVHMMFTRLP